MSDDESFLGRWSRRKRQAQASKSRDPSEAVPAAAQAGHPPSAQVEEVSLPSTAEESSVVSALPPIDSLNAGSDITAFLAPGVPPQLTRAALRRAWTADPAIRDFIGLSENAWDFTAPDGVPGFGSLVPDDVRRLAEKILEQPKTPDAEAGSAGTSAAGGSDIPARLVSDPKTVPETPTPKVQEEIAAPQHELAQENPRKNYAIRRHGRALPQQ